MFNPLKYPVNLTTIHRLAPSTWVGHTPFAMFITDLLRPSVFVELGTYYGTSYCSFCQAVDQLGLETKCYAIDTWRGDQQSGYFGDEVLEDLRSYHDSLYGKFSRLIQSSFDEALVNFEENSIDLLHIDGFHTYKEVKNDFEKWLSKTSDRAIVLFHDINVRERGFGVWKFWKEIKKKYPNFEFIHSHGLGILAVGSQCSPEVVDFLSFANENKTLVQDYFYQMGRRFELMTETYNLRKHTAYQANCIRDYEARIQEIATKDEEYSQKLLSLNSREREIIAKDEDFSRKSHVLNSSEEKLKTKEDEFARKLLKLNSREEELIAKEDEFARKLLALNSREQELLTQEAEFAQNLLSLNSREQELVTQGEEFAQKFLSLSSREFELSTQDEEVAQKLIGLNTREQELAARNEEFAQKLHSLNSRELELAAQNEEYSKKLVGLNSREEYLRTQEEAFAEKLQNFTSREKELKIQEDEFGTTLNIQERNMQKESELESKEKEIETRLFDLRRKHEDIEKALIEIEDERNLLEKQSKKLKTQNQELFAKNLDLQILLRNIGNRDTKNGNLIESATDSLERLSKINDKKNLKFSIGVVTYNNPQDQIDQLLRSLESSVRSVSEMSVEFELLVIDNGDPSYFGESKLKIAKFDSKGNLGFGKGMNYLMSVAFADPRTQWFLCLNPDGVLHYKALNELLKSSKLNPLSLIEARQFPEEHLKNYDSKTLETPWASGACLVIPRQIYETIGGFDPNFFMYLEDVDLSWRTRSAGFSVKTQPKAIFGHAVLDREFSKDSDKYMLLSGRYLGLKWRNESFANWATSELIQRGYVSSVEDLPSIPDLAEYPELNFEIADFEYYFHFAKARW